MRIKRALLTRYTLFVRRILNSPSRLLKFINPILLGTLCVSCVSQEDYQVKPTISQVDVMSPLEAFQNLEEMENVPLKVTGKIPEWLQGDFVRNGPGIVKDKKGYVASWFDGLGKLYTFNIQNGKVTYTCKFLQSEAYQLFQKTGKFDFLGFAQQPTSDSFSFIDFLFDVKNTDIVNANVNITKINNKRVALTEIPLPVEFDRDLNTVGFFDYSDSLAKNYSFESAHILEEPDTKAMWNYLIDIGLFDTAYQIYKIPSCSRERQLVSSIPVSSISYMHSFSFAGRYFILIDYPLRAKKPQALAHEFIQAFSWNQNEPSFIYVIDKELGKCQTFITKPFFCFHHVNGFEKDGKIFIDLITYPNADIVYEVNYYPFIKNPTNTLVRLEIHPLENTVKVTQLSSEHFEFPRLNESLIGKDYRYFYAVHFRKMGDGIIKYDHQTSTYREWAQEGYFANEPVFIPHPHSRREDDGVVLSVVNNLKLKKSFLVILNASDFKELARIEAPHLIPFGFHGQFFKE